MDNALFNYTNKDIKLILNSNQEVCGYLSALINKEHLSSFEPRLKSHSQGDYLSSLKEMKEISLAYISFLTDVIDRNQMKREDALIEVSELDKQKVESLKNMISIAQAFPDKMNKAFPEQ